MTLAPTQNGWSQSPNKGGSPWVYVVGGFVAAVVLPFVPLILAGVESALFGTSVVEDFCRTIGIHGALDDFYDAILGRLMP